MKVTLIDYTQDAREKLIYTKSTRLTQGHDTREKIYNMTDAEKQKELEYMANTIPSSWEFVNYTFEIQGVTRAFTHQFVRTRTGSYAQQTMRMLEVADFTYETPEAIKIRPDADLIYDNCMREINSAYQRLLAMGIKAEDARGVLPTNIHTNIIAQFNLRTLADMAKSRTGGRTQAEYQLVFIEMANEVLRAHPWANQFLYPAKWQRLQTLERMISEIGRHHPNYNSVLKIIDQLKKESK